MDVIANFISILGTVLTLAIFIRALLSWFMPNDASGLGRLLSEITDPILRPIRQILPPVAGIDFSPIVAMIVIQVLRSVLVGLLLSTG